MGTLSNDGLDYAYDGIETGINFGTAVDYPRVSFQAADDTVLHEVNLQQDSLGASTAGAGTYNPPQGEIAWTGYVMTIGTITPNTPTKAVLYNRNNVAIHTGTVTTKAVGTGEWQFSTTSWSTGLEITIDDEPTFTVS